MLLSECCEKKVMIAKFNNGIFIHGQIVNEYYECSQCKQRCDIFPVDDENKEGANV